MRVCLTLKVYSTRGSSPSAARLEKGSQSKPFPYNVLLCWTPLVTGVHYLSGQFMSFSHGCTLTMIFRLSQNPVAIAHPSYTIHLLGHALPNGPMLSGPH